MLVVSLAAFPLHSWKLAMLAAPSAAFAGGFTCRGSTPYSISRPSATVLVEAGVVAAAACAATVVVTGAIALAPGDHPPRSPA